MIQHQILLSDKKIQFVEIILLHAPKEKYVTYVPAPDQCISMVSPQEYIYTD